MSLAETQQILADLQEIMALLNGVEVKSTKVVENTPQIQASGLSLRQNIRTLNEMLLLVQVATGNKNIDRAIQKTNQLTMILYRAYILANLVASAEFATMGPLGWAYAGAHIASIGLSINMLGQ